MTADTFIATSIARRLITRLQVTHDRRRISVFAGPPGIGKTTAIDVFTRRLPGNIVVVKIARREARETLVLKHVLDSLRRLAGSPLIVAPNSIWELRVEVYKAMCAWAGVKPVDARRGACANKEFPQLTVIFDEAQNLARESIEALRYWNDPDRCYAPFPVGLVFVGNSEFSLQTDHDGRSAISAAVADRALYVQTFDYGDVTDDDLRLFIEARGIVDAGAVTAVLRYFRTPRTARSLRQAGDLIDELLMVAAMERVTSDMVQDVLGVA